MVLLSASFLFQAAIWNSVAPGLAMSGDFDIDLLKARSAAVESFEADVAIVMRSGADATKQAESFRRFAEYLKRHDPKMSTKHLEEAATDRLKPFEITLKGHYWWQRPELQRFEYVPADRPAGAKPLISIYTGKWWEDFFEGPEDPKERLPGRSRFELNIHADRRLAVTFPFFEVLRGQALLFPKSAAKATESDIGLLLSSIRKDQISGTTIKLPGGESAAPCLEVRFPQDESIGPARRQRLWVDPTNGYLPVVLHWEQVIQRDGNGEPVYFLEYAIRWSEPVATRVGIDIPSKAAVSIFDYRPVPVEGVREENWRNEFFEEQVLDATFTNIRVNEPQPEGRFSIEPGPGTSVINEITGEVFAIGPLGERLKELAVAVREPLADAPGSLPQATKRSWFSTAALSGVGIALAGVATFFVVQWRKQKRAS